MDGGCQFGGVNRPLDVPVFRITLRAPVLRIEDSALRHGWTREDISRAYDLAILDKVLDEDADPPKC